MKVIFCDNDIIVCHKEHGELSECADESAKDSLPRQLGDYLAENGQKTHTCLPSTALTEKPRA